MNDKGVFGLPLEFLLLSFGTFQGQLDSHYIRYPQQFPEKTSNQTLLYH